MLKIEAFTLGLMIEANCYLVSEDGHALVIDPGSKGRSVHKRIEEMGLIVDAVLLTHGHFDHCAGADAFVETYHCPLYIHPLDAPMLKDPHLNFSADFAPLVVKSKPQMLKQGKQQIGHFEIEMIDAPGHSEGSCLLLMKDHASVLRRRAVSRQRRPHGSHRRQQLTDGADAAHDQGDGSGTDLLSRSWAAHDPEGRAQQQLLSVDGVSKDICQNG